MSDERSEVSTQAAQLYYNNIIYWAPAESCLTYLIFKST